MSKDQIEAFEVNFRNFSETDYLPMSVSTRLEITPEKNQSVSTIFLERCVARLDYNINIDAQASNIKLLSVQFKNNPCKSTPFGDALVSPDKNHYTDGSLKDISSTPSNFSGRVYLLENLQGTVNSIKSEKDKNLNSAPGHATYMQIRATDGREVYDYMIMLGENTISDFNVRRNTALTLNVLIKGKDELDSRIHNYIVEIVETELKLTDLNNIPDVKLEVLVNSKSGIYDLTCRIEVDCMDNSMVMIDENRTNNHQFPLPVNNIREVNIFTSYDVITSVNNNLIYRVIIEDNFGFKQIHTQQVTLYNHVVVTSNNTDIFPDAGGIRNIIGCDYVTFPESVSTGTYLVMVPHGGVFSCDIQVNRGYRFKGWYEHSLNDGYITQISDIDWDDAGTRLRSICYDIEKAAIFISVDLSMINLTTQNEFEIIPEENQILIYGTEKCSIRFTRTGIPFNAWLDKEGNILSTSQIYYFEPQEDLHLIMDYEQPQRLDVNQTANCYIIDINSIDPGKPYCFDGSVKGINKTVGDLKATPHVVHSATRLWEDYYYTGDLVTRCGVYGNDVEFTLTGTAGNALIGVLDENRNIVWSYHIWIADTQQVVNPSKMVGHNAEFMAANLGALTVTSPGLYYQWGRKDPFPEASDSPRKVYYYIDYYKQFVSAADFGTIQYAIANPTHFILGRAQTKYGWMLNHDPTLWGSIYNGNEFNTKTIYDPCPPGYRVPYGHIFDCVTIPFEKVIHEQGYIHYDASGPLGPPSYVYLPLGGSYSYLWGEHKFVNLKGSIISAYAPLNTGATVSSQGHNIEVRNDGSVGMDFNTANLTSAGSNVRCIKE
ncbi:MAG: DUF4906 domain-containing protein [Alistipes sp.]|nr:DUF4906 domain-containing protein [Alistipes sp.]